MNIADRLERLRLKKGFTWEGLGDQMLLSRSMLHYVRKNGRLLSARAIYRLEQLEREAGLEPMVEWPLRSGNYITAQEQLDDSVHRAADTLREDSPAYRVTAPPGKKNVIEKLRQQVHNLQTQIDAINKTLDEL